MGRKRNEMEEFSRALEVLLAGETLCLVLLAALCMSIPLLVCRRMRKENGGQ